MNNFMIPMTFEAITSFSMVDSTRKFSLNSYAMRRYNITCNI